MEKIEDFNLEDRSIVRWVKESKIQTQEESIGKKLESCIELSGRNKRNGLEISHA